MEFSIEVIQLMHPGQRKDSAGRPHQEDSTFPGADNINNSDRLFIVCDGMGGHDAGEVASDTVCRVMGDYITSNCDARGDFSPKDLDNAINAAFDALDDADTGASRKMGTTMAMLKLYNKGAIVAHIGDSRVYHIRPDKIHETAKVLHRTFDHSLVFNLIKAKIITEEQARTAPNRNVITKAMQPHLDNRPKPDVTKITDIQAGDFFYLCSDGMLENMENPDIEEIFAKEGNDLNQLKTELLRRTEDNHDNHTGIIVYINSVCRVEDEELSDDFDKSKPIPVSARATPTPPEYKLEKFKNSSNSTSAKPPKAADNDEITCLFNDENTSVAGDVNDSEATEPGGTSKKRRKSKKRRRSLRLILSIVACLLIIAALAAFYYYYMYPMKAI